MKRIKAMNGYTIYEVTARDEKQGNGTAGEFSVYFSSDIRDYGREYSTPEFEGLESLELAEEVCKNKFALAKEELEQKYTAVSYDDIIERAEEMEQEERIKVTVTYNFGSVVTIGVRLDGRTLEQAILDYSEDIEGAIIDGQYKQLRTFEDEEEETEQEQGYEWHSEYFYGHKISDYGLEHGYVDYKTLASAFDAVLNNEIFGRAWEIGYGWEQESGYDEDEEPAEVFQWYIVTDAGAEILKEFGEIVYYHSDLDMYLWGVTHWGTAWDYVLTDIRIVKEGTR